MMRVVRDWLVIAVAAVAAVVAVNLLLPPFWQFMIGSFCIVVIIVIGIKVLLGVAGIISVAAAAFFGIGAYGVSILVGYLQIEFLTSVLLTLVVSVLVSLLLGATSIRLSGFYLAIVTLGFVQFFSVLIRQGGDLTGGATGLIAPIFELPFIGRITDSMAVNIAIGSALVIAAMMSALVRSRFGRALFTLKRSDVLAQTLEVPATRLRLAAFVIAGILATYAGVLNALLLGFSVPEAYSVDTSIHFLAYAVIGGLDGSMIGAFVGTAIPFFLPELIEPIKEWKELFFGILLLATLVLAPNGVTPPLMRAVRRLALWRKDR